MKTAIELVGLGLVMPTGIAMAFFYFIQKALAADLAARYAAPWSLVIAFTSSYFCLSWTEFLPARHWHWLPYVGLAAGVCGSLAWAAGIRRAERWLLYLGLAIAAAWLLVPNWSTLEPKRPTLVAVLAAYFFVLVILLELLPDRLVGNSFLGLVALAAGLTAIAVAMSVSLKYGQSAAMIAGAAGGCWLAHRISGSEANLRGAIPVYVLLNGGVGFVGGIDPQPAMYEFLILPACPLMLWCLAYVHSDRLGPRLQTLLSSLAVAIPGIGVLLYAAMK